MKKTYWGILAFVIIVICTPLGLLADGDAWGEWDPDQLKEAIGFVPQGMAHFPVSWNALLPDYSIAGISDSFAAQAGAYILSAVVGIVIIAIVFLVCNRLVSHKA